MKEYIILEKVDTFPTLVRTMYSQAGISPLSSQSLRLKSFKTYQEAVLFAYTLDYSVTIYESVAKIEIEHKETKIDEHTNDTPSKQD